MRHLFATILLTLSALSSAMANVADMEPTLAAPNELTLDENIATPQVPEKRKELVKSFMRAKAKELAAKHLNVEMLRHGEVFAVVIPASDLFLPNDTLLRSDAAVKAKLNHLKPLFDTAGRYKMIIVAHSDDTGNEAYRLALTEKRVSALFDWFDSNFVNTESIYGYGAGSDIPLKSNATAAGRKANRRVEIYIVPDTPLIESLRRK